jgi:hypothetical protein
VEQVDEKVPTNLMRTTQFKHDTRPFSLAVGDVVIIFSEERNRGKWPLGIVQELYPGKDGVIRTAKIKTGNGHLDRAVNLLYPLEL